MNVLGIERAAARRLIFEWLDLYVKDYSIQIPRVGPRPESGVARPFTLTKQESTRPDKNHQDRIRNKQASLLLFLFCCWEALQRACTLLCGHVI